MSSIKEPSISSITPLTSENYRSWADDIKSWLQLNGLWRLVSGLERKPVRRAEVRDTQSGNVVTLAVWMLDDGWVRALGNQGREGAEPSRLPCPQMSEFSSGTMRTTLFSSGRPSKCHSFSSALHHASMHTMPSLSVQKLESESLEGLINRVAFEHIMIIKSLSPSSFTPGQPL